MSTNDRLRERLHSLRKSLVRPYEKAKKKDDKVEMRRLEGLTAELDGVWERLDVSGFGQLVADITALKLKIEGHALSGTGMISGISLDDLKDKIKEILSVPPGEEPGDGPGSETPVPVFPEPTDGEAPPPVDISPVVVIDDPGISDSGALILTEAHLIGLWKRSQFPIDGRGIIVFGLRGCRPVDFAGTGFAQAHEIVLREINYMTMNCTLGQWRPNAGLAIFPGSTVPFHTIIAGKVGKRGVGVNQMGCGRYKNYARGWHKRSEGPSGHWALRQECAITIQRTGDDTDYDLEDRWEVGRIAGDNIHCAFHMGADGAIPDSRFSSAGCQTIAGTVKKGVPASERGPWKKFIAPFQRGTGVQDSTEYVLFLAEEAQQMIRTRCAGKSVILRMGSTGPLVRKLQEVLSARLARPITVDEDFGAETFQAVIDFQTDVFGNDADDGIVGPETAEELGIALPAFDFADAISGGPGFRAGTEIPIVTDGTGSTDSGDDVRKLSWGAVTDKKHGPDFKAKVIAIARRLQADPDHLMAVMAFETGGKFTPDVKNAAGSGATGLIQFMPKTAKSLGTSTKMLAKMTAVEQLDFVELYFRKTVGNRAMPNLSDVYMAVLWPRAVGKSENFVLFEKGTTAYSQNAGLDKNRDGFIRKAEAAAKVFDKLVLGQKEGRLG